MARKQPAAPPPLENREFRSPEEIDSAIAKLQRRIQELENLDIRAAFFNTTGAAHTAESNLRSTILEVFGQSSPEFREHTYIRIWSGPIYMNMSDSEVVAGMEDGRKHCIGIVRGLIGRLEEKRADFGVGASASPSSYFDRLNLHPRIRDVTRDLFLDGHHWDAVFNGAKALVNYIKERSGRHDLDGAPLIRAVFSRNNPILVFNDLRDETERDEQEGMMHLFEGAVLAIRNPGAHSFPEGSAQRAIEYLSLLSLLAYRVQEATRRKSS